MIIYILSAIIILIILINFFLGAKLYKEPKNPAFFNNVTGFNLQKEKIITADPKYVVRISILVGIAIGLYMALAGATDTNAFLVFGMVIIFMCVYLMELTKSISLEEGTLTYKRFLMPKKTISVYDIKGVYIYSFNKKFLKQHAYTTKLVVTLNDDDKIKMSLSSLDNRAVLNMMKDNFGVTNNKMYIANKKA